MLFAEQEITAVMTELTFGEHTLIEQFLDSLRELPGVHAELAQSEPAVQTAGCVDAKIDLHVAGKSIVLLVEAKKSVYPRDVRQALWQLKSLQHDHYADAQHLLIAESLSPGAKELLRAECIGYFDSGGKIGAITLLRPACPGFARAPSQSRGMVWSYRRGRTGAGGPIHGLGRAE
jgi:hypothetical protein